MNTSELTPGDRVEVNVRGLSFPARYAGRDVDALQPHRIEPLVRGITFRHVTSRQIVKKLEAAR